MIELEWCSSPLSHCFFGVYLMKSKLYIISAIVLILIFSGLFINVQNISAAPHLDDLDSGSLLDALYAILLASLVLFVAAGLGGLLIKPFNLTNWSFAERAILSLPLGLAAIGYGEFFLGVIGWLQPFHQCLFLLVVTGVGFVDGVRFLSEGWAAVRGFKQTWAAFSWLMKFFFAVGVAALLLALLQTFTPPFDYDGLMYHLQGPRLFLEAGRIIPIPENWFTYYPATWEMLFMLGMGLGSDIFSRLISFSTLLLFLLATFLLGKRFLPVPGGWLSTALVIGVPMMLAWGGFAYVDLAWSLFQFLAIGLLLIWIEKREDKFLVLSGIMQGLSLGSKYSALSNAGIIALCIVWLSMRISKKQQGFLEEVVSPTLKFGISAIVVASPWYIKNLIWTGNPIFPLFFHQEIVDPNELSLWMDYLISFGTGKHWFNYLLLPITLFSEFARYSTFVVFFDFPNPFMFLAFAYPLLRSKLSKNRLVFDTLAMITGVQFIMWATGSQQNRFLMPLYPGLSIIAVAVIIHLPSGNPQINWSRIISIGGIGGLMIGSLLLVEHMVALVKPHDLILGMTSKADFLTSIVKDYQAIKFINQNLPDDALVFMPWDGRGYYCDGKCVPDTSQSAWAALVQETDEIDNISSWPQEKGITHILLSWEDVNFFVYGHDPNGVHDQALSFFLDDYAPKCADLVYEDDWTQLYELHLDDVSCQ